MPGGVAGSVETEYLPVAKLEYISIFHKLSGSSLIDLVSFQVKAGRKEGSALDQILQHRLPGKGKPFEPRSFQTVDAGGGEKALQPPM